MHTAAVGIEVPVVGALVTWIDPSTSDRQKFLEDELIKPYGHGPFYIDTVTDVMAQSDHPEQAGKGRWLVTLRQGGQLLIKEKVPLRSAAEADILSVLEGGEVEIAFRVSWAFLQLV